MNGQACTYNMYIYRTHRYIYIYIQTYMYIHTYVYIYIYIILYMYLSLCFYSVIYLVVLDFQKIPHEHGNGVGFRGLGFRLCLISALRNSPAWLL